MNELIIYQCNKKGMSITDLDDNGLIKAHVLADKIRTYFVTADSEKEARVSLKDIIANTYYRG